MDSLKWFDRKMSFGLPKEMLPFYLERLDGTLARMERKVKGVSEKILSTKPDGKWSVKQHIGHLSEVDAIANRRIKEMLDGVPEMSPAVFEPQEYSAWPMERVLEQFQKNRAANLNAYKAIPESGLLKSSLHPRLKVQMTPVDLAWFDAEHDDHHLVKINEILFTFQKQ